MAENIQAQLGSFDNVEVRIRTVELAEFVQLRATHDFDSIITSALFRDPEPRLSTVFGGDSPANMPGIDDPALNDALLSGRTATSEEDRKKAYNAVQERLTELTPMFFVARGGPGAISGRNVGGLVQYGLGSLLPEELWIKP
ncbi:hypothetical protein [Parafrankia sp. BMG5.11]|uniref:hypothetical protein n=1 Tax=Parafrankia sp. BMG5.11 TaxID=222540 RepID=UPI000DA447D6